MTKEFLRESIRHSIMIHDQLDVSKVIRDQNTGTVFLCAGIEHDDQRIRFTIDPDSKVVAFFTLVFTRGCSKTIRAGSLPRRKKSGLLPGTYVRPYISSLSALKSWAMLSTEIVYIYFLRRNRHVYP